MTTIAPFAAGSYIASRNTSQLLTLKSQLSDLTNQLSSGLTAQSYGGLGSGRTAALSAQASISALNGYSAVIDTAQTRAKLGTASLTQVATVAADTNTTLQNGLQSTSTDTQAAKSTALNNLNAALDALNQSDGSVYLFGGKNGSTPPVLDASTILYGTSNANGTVDGLSTIVKEQVAADLGPNQDGRLASSVTGSVVSLTEGASSRLAAPNGPFGFSVGGAVASNTASITFAQNATAGTSSLTVANQPASGDTVTVTLTLPDKSTTSITLTATSSATTSGANTFAIGANTDATASNLKAALASAIGNAATTTLSASATARASTNFFAASSDAGTTPRRVYTDPTTGGPTYAYPTTTPATAVKQSVVWYQGESGTDATARASQSFQIGSSATVQLGARANETPIQNVLAGLATVALGMPTGSTASNAEAYQAVVAQATPLLAANATGDSVQDMVTDFSLASARMSNAKTANAAQQSTLQDTVDGIEQASTEEVATKLLDLQTRLQASYQITASLSKLSLVNYIS
ncbi:flagellin [Methylobacterium sp. J-067]|uniref:flagellin n=1 Tax=Methylobacterium sp. J-067 TaxID=2836648 RepID=UPI001FB9CBEC|nr:flagellin [Methylobacterium sp. J-067]MCJ2025695.1 flagellin [Methylobacterium sp. J-067]